MGILSRRDQAEEPSHRARPAAYRAVRSITAAAAIVPINNATEVERMRRRRTGDQWQADAWEYYDAIGEIKYAFGLVGAIISRVRLYTAAVTRDDTAPSRAEEVEDLEPGIAEAAHMILNRLSSAHGGIPGLLSAAAINLSVAGECYLIQSPERAGSGIPESWNIRSVDELIVPASSRQPFRLKTSGSSGNADLEELPQGSVVGRIWRTHPRYSDDADSSMRGMLDLMDELLLLNRTSRATAKSRLNAGALLIPEGIAASYEADGETDESLLDPDLIAPEADTGSDEFEEVLTDALATPIKDESSASAVVPVIIRGPADQLKEIRLLKFERPFDPQMNTRADRVLERVLAGLDVPKDVVTGLAHVKYSNAVQIEESLYKAHIEPMCLLLCDALTEIFLRPMLRARGYSDEACARLVVWYDPSEITTKPDKATAATQGYQMGALSDDAWRRANGFTEADAPTALERLQRAAVDRGQLSEPLVEALLKTMAPELMNKVRADALASSPAPLPGDAQQLLGEGDGSGADVNTAPVEPPPTLAEPTPTDASAPAPAPAGPPA